MENDIYDLAIIGTGPAGLSASLYASRFGINHVVIGGLMGGLISESHHIDNYLGVEDATGFEFGQKITDHVKKYGVEIIPILVRHIEKENNLFKLSLDSTKEIKARTILLATGTKRRKLGAKGEEEFAGKGISYCATCDGFFYKGKTVAVVGGSDSAAGAAIYLADIAEKVYVIYRGSELRCETYWKKKIEENPKIKVLCGYNLKEVAGDQKLQKVILDNDYEGKSEIELDGLFIEVGSDPSVDFAKDLGVEEDKSGYIKIRSDCSTSIEGVWAAGDITDGSDKFRQVITAAAEGAIAARSIFNYLKRK